MPEYEGTIIRPPSEADSLILQYTIGCSHNQCVFCPAYKGKQFRIRSNAEMELDILSCLPDCKDTRRIFLADGDALAASQQELTGLFELLGRYFPNLKRIGMYANARSILVKSIEELIALRKQRLGILYMGVESGDEALLEWMEKGATPDQMVEAAHRVREAGIKLSVTVLLGIGGKEGSILHARKTGRLLSEMNPNYVGALTTMVVPGTPLYRLQDSDGFTLPDSFGLLEELAEMIEHTEMRGIFFANHASNYLPVQVRMPVDRDGAVKMIREFVMRRDPSSLKPEQFRGL